VVVTTTLVRDASEAVLARIADYASDAGITLNVYSNGQVPPYPEEPADQDGYYPYVVAWSWQRTDSSRRRISDDSTSRPFRVVTQFVGGSLWEAQWAEDHVDAAMRGARLEIADAETTPCHYEAGAGVAPDADLEQVFAGSAAWTFVVTPTLE
jgi:hypothetical protein